jgi:hypothetical protein
MIRLILNMGLGEGIEQGERELEVRQRKDLRSRLFFFPYIPVSTFAVMRD